MGLLYNTLNSFGLLNEMTDWKNHFINGTKGMPKTELPILNYVENILKKAYENNPEKVTTNPIAPWMVMAINQIGPANINTAKLNNIRKVIEYFQKTGNASFLKASRNSDGNFDITSIEQAGEYSNNKLEILKQKELAKANGEKFVEPEKEKAPESKPEEVKIEEKPIIDNVPSLEAEAKGQIERVWMSNDGSGRMWVKVIDPKWLTEKCGASHAKERKWGVMCQSNTAKFLDGSHTNFQFIGPSKLIMSIKNAPIEYSTIVGMAVLNSTGLIAELKQEGNAQPGIQKSSGGWDDAAEQVVSFISYSPIMKSIVKGFGTYGGQLPINSHTGTYGGDAFVNFLGKNKPELLNELADARYDIVENNVKLLEAIMGADWFDERYMDIEEYAQTKPNDFLEKFESFYQRFGKQASQLLINMDLEGMLKKHPRLVLNSIGSLVGIVPFERFQNLFKNINIKTYITEYNQGFKLLLKNMANEKDFKPLFQTILNQHDQDIIEGFGKGGVGIFKFLQYAASPRLRVHQNAVMDNVTGEYSGVRKVLTNPQAPFEERNYKNVPYIVTDDLKVLNQKERRAFIVKHEEYIKSLTPKLDDKGKQINYLRYLFSESNTQDVERTMAKEKGEFVNYFNSKFNANETKKVKLPNGQIIEKPYLPGIIEFYSALNKKKPGYAVTKDVADINFIAGGYVRQMNHNDDLEKKQITYYPLSLADAKIYEQDLLKHFYSIRTSFADDSADKTKKERQIRYSTIKDYLFTLKLSGEKDETLLNEITNGTIFSKLKIEPKSDLKEYLGMIKEILEPKLASITLKSMLPEISKMGMAEQNIINKLLDGLRVSYYHVKAGEMVQFTESDNDKSKHTNRINYNSINLRYGRKYQILETRNGRSSGEHSALGAINSEVKVLDEGKREITDLHGQVTPAEMPQERWFPTFLFEVKVTFILPDELPAGVEFDEDSPSSASLNEVRTIIRKRIKMISEKIENKKKRISYTGIVLDNRSKDKLSNFLKTMIKAGKITIPDDWKFSADHITINMGPAIDPSILGKESFIKVLTYSFDENVVAIGVKLDMDVEFEKENPHITIAYNNANGARPVMSNNLKFWKPVPKSFLISGIIKEVMQDL